MSALAGHLEAGDVVDVTYYNPVEGLHATIAEHRANGVYKTYRGVTLLHVWTGRRCGYCERMRLDGCPLIDETHWSFRDPIDASCGGISYGSTDWADISYAETGALF